MRHLFCLIVLCLSFDAQAQSLIQPEWLVTPKKPFHILEIDTEESIYQGPHIPKALYSSFYKDGWSIDYPPLLNMLPNAPAFSQTVSRFGLSLSDKIVIVPVHQTLQNISAAARVFWSFKSYGYQHIHLLDGGLKAYVEQGFPTSKRPRRPKFRKITLTNPTQKWLATYDQVYDGADYGTPVIDARDYDRAGGETRRHELALRQGKIFDAVIVPAEVHLQEGRFKPEEEIRNIYADVWGDPAGPIVFYSDTGLRAALSWFSAHEILRQKDVRLYDGSYLEWDHLGHEVYDETDDMGGPIGG